MPTLVLLRHGQSSWNALNLFTGWHDVPLTEQGRVEARRAGELLGGAGIDVDVVHTSLQQRAVTTANLALEQAQRLWLPQRRHWRLNERHYGDLQGRNKAETAALYGDEQVHLWRRSYGVRPPPVPTHDPRHPRNDPRYAGLAPDVLPDAECLADVVTRMLPYWHDAIAPDLLAGRCVLVVAHGNSLRALVKHLGHISDDDISSLEIPTGVPLVFELDDELQPVASRYLGAPADAASPTGFNAEPDDPGDEPHLAGDHPPAPVGTEPG
ncbi:MAG TPA: 2,3-diphosphoglycerate-dependent phosphoglycerate mutase [Acidimicrobiales bacterium]|nr:2,3-diphosphoglycerate-dependent phosphoglycerate mutase [Acidimicrobiales bacterium]